MIEIVVAPEDRRDDIWEMFLEYGDELTSFDGETRPHHKRHYPYFDLYWEEEERTPFLFLYDHEPIGFCLLRDTGVSYQIAEFYIRPLHRRRGFARKAVDHVQQFCRDLGRHKLLAANIYVNNHPAIAFWKSVGFNDTGRRTRIRSIRMIETEFELGPS